MKHPAVASGSSSENARKANILDSLVFLKVARNIRALDVRITYWGVFR